jgi:hypothetical protein
MRRANGLADAKTRRLPSGGDHNGFQSLEGSNVIREGTARAISIAQMSRWPFTVES